MSNRLYARKIDGCALIRLDFVFKEIPSIRENKMFVYSPEGFVFLDHGREPEQNVDPSSPS